MNKLVVLAGALALCLCGWDAYSRFAVTANSANANLAVAPLPVSKAMALTETQQQQLKQTIELLQGQQQDIVEDAPVGLSQAELDAQTGHLQTVFTKDKKLALKAIIVEGSQPFALIEETNLIGNETALRKYQTGQQLYGFTLAVESATQVSLSRATQNITLLMYKSATNEGNQQ